MNNEVSLNTPTARLRRSSTMGAAVAQSNIMAAATARTHAGRAVSAAAAYSTIIAGIIVSIGTDTGR